MNRYLEGRILSCFSRILQGMRNTLPALLLVASLGSPAAFSFPVRISPSELAAGCDLIVLVKVESISGIPFIGKRWAKAQIIETWKGSTESKTLEFRASGSEYDACDVSHAVKGETVLLFLNKAKQGVWTIAHSGRGRMPIRNIMNIRYVAIYDLTIPKDIECINLENEDSYRVGVKLDTFKSHIIEHLKR